MACRWAMAGLRRGPREPHRSPTRAFGTAVLRRADSVWKIVQTLLLALACHLIGTAMFFAVVAGPGAIWLSPILAGFGWFFIVPELVVAGQQIRLLRTRPRVRLVTVWLLTVLPAAIVMTILGPKQDGASIRFAWAYFTATIVGATVMLALANFTVRPLNGSASHRSS